MWSWALGDEFWERKAKTKAKTKAKAAQRMFSGWY
jgi:hypothetical protein